MIKKNMSITLWLVLQIQAKIIINENEILLEFKKTWLGSWLATQTKSNKKSHYSKTEFEKEFLQMKVFRMFILVTK